MVLLSLQWDLVAVFGIAIATAVLARWANLPVTALEIAAGILLVGLLGFGLPGGIDSLLIFGSLLIVFLAGLETNFDFLRAHLRAALTIGLPGFLVPFFGLFALLFYGLHAPLIIALVGASALADTSISIVYTTLQQYELTELPFGRLVLAATLAVNLAEDLTVTSTTLLSTPALLFTLGVLGALAVAALALPRVARWVASRLSGTFTNVEGRTLFFSLAILAALSSLVGVPGILFVFLLGLMFSRFARETFLVQIRQIAFAVFVPFYFISVGLKVSAGAVLADLPALLAILAAASALKLVAIYPPARLHLGRRLATPVTVLMNTRLTSATVILTLTLALGILTTAWYSLFITAVVALALLSTVALRGFDVFRSPAAARAAFALGPEPQSSGRPRPRSGPTVEASSQS